MTINGNYRYPSLGFVVECIENWLMYHKLAGDQWHTVVWRFKNDDIHGTFAKKRYTVTVTVSLSWFYCSFNMPSIADFSSNVP